MRDEPGDDREGEGNVGRNRNREVLNSEVNGCGPPDATPRLRDQIGGDDTHSHINDFGPGRCFSTYR